MDTACAACEGSSLRRPSGHADGRDDAVRHAESLRRRRDAAAALGNALVTEVPLLYGFAGMESGDPGIVLARLHRDTLVRHSGGGLPMYAGCAAPDPLPFERGLLLFSIILMIAVLSG